MIEDFTTWKEVGSGERIKIDQDTPRTFDESFEHTYLYRSDKSLSAEESTVSLTYRFMLRLDKMLSLANRKKNLKYVCPGHAGFELNGEYPRPFAGLSATMRWCEICRDFMGVPEGVHVCPCAHYGEQVFSEAYDRILKYKAKENSEMEDVIVKTPGAKCPKREPRRVLEYSVFETRDDTVCLRCKSYTDDQSPEGVISWKIAELFKDGTIKLSGSLPDDLGIKVNSKGQILVRS